MFLVSILWKIYKLIQKNTQFERQSKAVRTVYIDVNYRYDFDCRFKAHKSLALLIDKY